ncbi:MAG: GNAT family N-acetyltransferase [Negativicutes bacterium]|nr:GNAT family N-acetyltransferase [Negativicutes bacterium]
MRKAVAGDLPGIMKVMLDTIKEMRDYNNTQWDETYPCESDFAADIEAGELYVAERGGKLAGFICINRIEPHEYAVVPWSRESAALVIHRMAVDSTYRGQGVGAELVGYAGALADHFRIDYLKTDTYSLNTNAQKLFEGCGYRQAGTMNFRGKEKPFICYEKSLV